MSPEKYSYEPNYCNAIKFVKCPNGYYPTSFKELVDRLHGRNGSTTLDRTIEKPLVIVPLHPGTWTSERGQKVIHTINLFMDTLLPTMFDEGTNSSTKLNPPQQSRFGCFISKRLKKWIILFLQTSFWAEDGRGRGHFIAVNIFEIKIDDNRRIQIDAKIVHFSFSGMTGHSISKWSLSLNQEDTTRSGTTAFPTINLDLLGLRFLPYNCSSHQQPEWSQSCGRIARSMC